MACFPKCSWRTAFQYIYFFVKHLQKKQNVKNFEAIRLAAGENIVVNKKSVKVNQRINTVINNYQDYQPLNYIFFVSNNLLYINLS